MGKVDMVDSAKPCRLFTMDPDIKPSESYLL